MRNPKRVCALTKLKDNESNGNCNTCNWLSFYTWWNYGTIAGHQPNFAGVTFIVLGAFLISRANKKNQEADKKKQWEQGTEKLIEFKRKMNTELVILKDEKIVRVKP